jgi:hypothetical protein
MIFGKGKNLYVASRSNNQRYQTKDALKTANNLTDGIVAPLTSAKLRLHLYWVQYKKHDCQEVRWVKGAGASYCPTWG